MREARVDRLEATLQRLAEAQVRTQEQLATLTEQVARLAARVDQLTAQIDRLTARVDRLDARVAWLTGDALERRYRERVHGYFQGILTRIEVISGNEFARLAFEAEQQATISRAEHDDLLRADVVARGRRREHEGEAYLIAEISVVIDKGDIERAVRRAAVCQRMTGLPVIPAAAGEQILPDAEQEAAASGVWCVLDGRVRPPLA